ncbi:hypothetical protein L2E82_17162 [Cichorium intybus]|uniref:Uncharacterized protein n=1 Tax=Cichorium intybus TaxID=13427 RepID=A0ACB9F6Z9_CICIN|nr:hypothetical protein L2E82_17162 [Cichorium intybus]
MPNVLYVEGYALDRFAEGLWALHPVHQNKVGLVLDAGIEEQVQVADATRAYLGLPNPEYIITDTPLQMMTLKMWMIIGKESHYKPSGSEEFQDHLCTYSALLPPSLTQSICPKSAAEEVKVSNYWEAIGAVAAHKARVDPNSLRRDKDLKKKSRLRSG